MTPDARPDPDATLDDELVAMIAAATEPEPQSQPIGRDREIRAPL